MNKHRLIRFLALILCIVLLLAVGSSSASAKVEEGGYGSIFRFNGVVFGDFQGLQADVEGALAVGGNGTFGSELHGFDITAAASTVNGAEWVIIGDLYPASNTLPVLLLGGEPNLSVKGCHVHGGNIVGKTSYKSTYEALQPAFDIDSPYGIEYHDDQAVESFFDSGRQQIYRLSNRLREAGGKQITLTQFKSFTNLQDYETDEIPVSGKALSVTIDNGGSVSLGETSWTSDITKYDVVVFNILDETVTFSGAVVYNGSILDTGANGFRPEQNALLKELCPKIIWNLPNATQVSLNSYGMVGTLIAPQATVTGSGGSINGRLFCENLTQKGGMELHNLVLNTANELLDWPEEPDEGSSEEESSEESSEEESSEESSEEESSEESSEEESSEESSEEESSEESSEEESSEESSEEESSEESSEEESSEESSEEESSEESSEEESSEESSEEESSGESSEEESSGESSEEESSGESSEEESSEESSEEESSGESSEEESSEESSEEESSGESSEEESSGESSDSSRSESSRRKSSPAKLTQDKDQTIGSGLGVVPEEQEPSEEEASFIPDNIVNTENPETGARRLFAGLAGSGLLLGLLGLLLGKRKEV